MPVVTVTFPVSAPAGGEDEGAAGQLSRGGCCATELHHRRRSEALAYNADLGSFLPTGTGVTNEMQGDAPMFSEKKVPSAGKGLQPWLFVPTIFPLVCCIKGAEG